ncbi:MAG: LysM peptidoglycan-binding domain-containing protein [Chloroflexota bacterium]
MNRKAYLFIILFCLGGLFAFACSPSPGEPTPEPVIIVPATLQPTAVALVTEVPEETSVPVELTATAEVIEATATAEPTTEPVQACIPPAPPEGTFYVTYGIQPGDTLYSIGQSTRPPTSVDLIVEANCLVNPDQIEVGQTLLVLHSPSTGPQNNQLIAFTPSQIGAGISLWFEKSQMVAESQGFVFEAEAGKNLTLIDRSRNDFLFELKSTDGTIDLGSVSTSERHYLDPFSAGKDFLIPETTEYRLTITGSPNAFYDLGLTLGDQAHPILDTPQEILFAPGESSAFISGSSREGILDRYSYWAEAGQIVSIDGGAEWEVIWIEDQNQTILYGQGQNAGNEIVLQQSGEYILSVFHATESFFYRDYDFTISITNPTVAEITPTPIPNQEAFEEILFTPVMGGQLYSQISSPIGADGIGRYKFQIDQPMYLLVNVPRGAGFTTDLNSADGTIELGSFDPNARVFLYPERSGHDFWLPAATAYYLIVRGPAGTPLDMSVFLRGYPETTLDVPQPVAFESGSSSAVIADIGVEGTLNRYLLRANEGQTMTIDIGSDPTTVVFVEDSQENIILEVYEGGGSVTLPSTGDYILTAYLGGSEAYRPGPFDFTVTID